MKAITNTEYGSSDVLKLTEVERPTPKEHEVLIRIRAASVNPLDWRLLRGKPAFTRLMIGGLRRPKITRPGVDVAGRVEAVDPSVTGFKPGDEVFGVCRGAFAEYACAAEDKLALKPANLSFEEAAAVPVAAMSALQALRDKGGIHPGQKVLIEGASGGVGTFAVQIAKSFGADVTAVCSTGNVDRARSLGADQVIDYTREDFTRSGLRYDLIIGANSHRSIFELQTCARSERDVRHGRRRLAPDSSGNGPGTPAVMDRQQEDDVLHREDNQGRLWIFWVTFLRPERSLPSSTDATRSATWLKRSAISKTDMPKVRS